MQKKSCLVSKGDISLAFRKASQVECSNHIITGTKGFLLAQPTWGILHVEYGTLLILSYPVILQHPGIHSCIFPFNFQRRLGNYRLDHEVVVTVWAVFVTLLEFRNILSKALLAFLACKCHVVRLDQFMILLFAVAVCAIEPFPTTGRADSHLRV